MAKSKRLVIDACVARASGPPGSTHPTSSRCREFLEGVRRICHRMTFTTSIAEEWNEHQSSFARRWRVSMHARKKIEFIRADPDPILRGRIGGLAADGAIAAIILKDFHLIEAAIGSDHRIASIETHCFLHLRDVAGGVKEISKLGLVNPDNVDHDPIGWLEAGAPIRGIHKLIRPAAEG